MVELHVHPSTGERASATRWFAAFVTVEAVVLLAIVTDLLPHLLPARLATQVGHNSESFVLAILLSTTILVLRRRAPARTGAASWFTAGVAAATVALVVLGLLLWGLDGAPRLKTLNEPVLAAALLVPYCAVRPRTRLLAVASLVVVVLAGVFFQTDLVRLQAEGVVALVLAPVGLDLAARWMLSPSDPQPTSTAWAWTVFLLVTPFVLMVLKPLDLGSFLDAVVLYAARGNEAFWGLFLVHALGLVAWSSRPVGVRTGTRHAGEVLSG